MTEQERIELLNKQYEIILKEESYLKSTDYIAAKLAEGAATKEEYSEKIVKRQAAREAINSAKDEIARLESVEVEEITSPDEE